jgi:hypothetical protein
MDKSFIEALAKDYTLLEGMELNIDFILKLSKYFLSIIQILIVKKVYLHFLLLH